MFLGRCSRKRKDGTRYVYWALRATVWDKAQRRNVQKYLAYVGPSKTISLDRAQKIAQKLGISVEELRRVKGLRIKD